ncbi:MAG: PIN domain-containing protein [Candidatus Parabeggiatoa sp. nov. 3]|nr:MAG: PIN domain-containing protein [Gammaproteobacteria bacterium]RKZ62616.1 MAG: PIN domain-containing protein [Gammaproteobacteria bacterium]RKZ87852.1 MAG: PIN domain-containing protein [Gammaproteobacteria bacterium]HEW97322.1 PIN domain-containing protein [Beggiatoa sp.]
MKKIYLDVCCFNRPFDEQTQERIKLEAEAILLILKRFELGEWQWISSETVDFEVAQMPSVERKNRVNSLMATISPDFILLDTYIIDRGEELEKQGFDVYDALHVACAEQGQADAFLTTDDKMCRLGTRYSQQLNVRIENPLKWFQEMINESASNDTRTDSPDGD